MCVCGRGANIEVNPRDGDDMMARRDFWWDLARLECGVSDSRNYGYQDICVCLWGMVSGVDWGLWVKLD